MGTHLNCRDEEINATVEYFMIHLHERMLPTRQGSHATS